MNDCEILNYIDEARSALWSKAYCGIRDILRRTGNVGKCVTINMPHPPIGVLVDNAGIVFFYDGNRLEFAECYNDGAMFDVLEALLTSLETADHTHLN